MSFPSIVPLLQGYSETVPDTTIRTTMDQGPAKVRSRTTAGVRTIVMTYLLNATTSAALDAFYLTGCANGSLTFPWTHPRTGAAVTARFTTPPVYTPVAGGNYYGAVTLEIMP